MEEVDHCNGRLEGRSLPIYLVDKRFGLSQLLPKCLIPSVKTFFCMLDIAFERLVKSSSAFYKNKEVSLHDFDYTLSYHCTQEFEAYRGRHWSLVHDQTIMVRLLVDVLFLLRDKSMFIVNTQTFPSFFFQLTHATLLFQLFPKI